MGDDNTEERVWSYLINNRKTATARDVALNCDVTEQEAQSYIDRIGSANWREQSNVFLKADADKPRVDLLAPEAIMGISHVLTYGANKYSANNWAKGADWSRYYSAMMRHMVAWWAGEDADDETGMSHLWHAGCCLSFLIAYEAREIGNDDRMKGASDVSVVGQESTRTKTA